MWTELIEVCVFALNKFCGGRIVGRIETLQAIIPDPCLQAGEISI